jgi:hypothetical protein
VVVRVREKEVGDLVRPVVEAAGLELWEVSFGREGGRRILRVTVDRARGDERAGGRAGTGTTGASTWTRSRRRPNACHDGSTSRGSSRIVRTSSR